MDFRDDIANKVEQMRDKLIGSPYRNKFYIIEGEIVDVVYEVDEHYKSGYYYLILDNGKKINTLRIKEFR